MLGRFWGGLTEKAGHVYQAASNATSTAMDYAVEALSIADATKEIVTTPSDVKKELVGIVSDVREGISQISNVLAEHSHLNFSPEAAPIIGNVVALVTNPAHENRINSMNHINQRIYQHLTNRIDAIDKKLASLLLSVKILSDKLIKYRDTSSAEKNEESSHIQQLMAKINRQLDDMRHLIDLMELIHSSKKLKEKLHHSIKQLEVKTKKLTVQFNHAFNLYDGLIRTKRAVGTMSDSNLFFWWAQHIDGLQHFLHAPSKYMFAKLIPESGLMSESMRIEGSLRWISKMAATLNVLNIMAGVGLTAKAIYQSRNSVLDLKNEVDAKLLAEMKQYIATILPASSDWPESSQSIRIQLYQELHQILLGNEGEMSGISTVVQNILVNSLLQVGSQAARVSAKPLSSAIAQLLLMVGMSITAYRRELASDAQVDTHYIGSRTYRMIAETTGFRNYSSEQSESLYMMESQLLAPVLYWLEMSLYKHFISHVGTAMISKYADYKLQLEIDKLVVSGEIKRILTSTIEAVLKNILLNEDELNHPFLQEKIQDRPWSHVIREFVKNVAAEMTHKAVESDDMLQAIIQKPQKLGSVHHWYGKTVDATIAKAGTFISFFSRSGHENVAADMPESMIKRPGQ